ncbi:MAG TPA: hypothetical protein VL944_03565 [Candidatus Acidoferrum sp.]|nr:hypothetical protein [Candidatus Acidoferrum sp.]
MDAKKRKAALFIGAIVIAVMFVTSYVAFGSNGGASSTTTSIGQAAYPVFGTVNALVTGYGSTLTVFLTNSSVGGALNTTLTNLEANGSIANYLSTPSEFIIYASGSNAYSLQQLFGSTLPANSIRINATEKIMIPQTITLYYYGQAIRTYPNIFNFTISSAALQPIGANTTVNVQALVTSTGQVYNNNLGVT